MSDIREISVPGATGVYHEYTCSGCGETTRNSYCEPYRTKMLERRLCYLCNHHVDFGVKLAHEHATMTIIEGRVYGPGNRTSGSFLGMAGRRFDIEYIEPSVYAGQKITTFDLWAGTELTDGMRQKYSDTARFLGGAEFANVGGVGCWDSSDARSERYQPPSSLRSRQINT